MASVRYEIQVDEHGNFAVPEALRETLGLQTGDLLTVLQDENGLLMIPTRLVLPEVAERITHLLTEAGLTVADLLAGLDEAGDEIYQETYGNVTTN